MDLSQEEISGITESNGINYGIKVAIADQETRHRRDKEGPSVTKEFYETKRRLSVVETF